MIVRFGFLLSVCNVHRKKRLETAQRGRKEQTNQYAENVDVVTGHLNGLNQLINTAPIRKWAEISFTKQMRFFCVTVPNVDP